MRGCKSSPGNLHTNTWAYFPKPYFSETYFPRIINESVSQMRGILHIMSNSWKSNFEWQRLLVSWVQKFEKVSIIHSNVVIWVHFTGIYCLGASVSLLLLVTFSVNLIQFSRIQLGLRLKINNFSWIFDKISEIYCFASPHWKK